MKKKLILLSAVAICIAIAAAGTLAYFTADTTAHNVITSGGVDIGIQEWADTERTIEYEDPTVPAMPKTEVTKVAEVYNELNSAEAWVRVKLEKVVEPDKKIIEELEAEGKSTEINTDLIKLHINTDKWEFNEDDGYYYCLEKLGVTTKDADGKVTYAVTPAIFDKVEFDAAMGNQFQNAKVTIKITAEAVQTAHNGDTVYEALGWPGSDPAPEPSPEVSDDGSDESLPLQGEVARSAGGVDTDVDDPSVSSADSSPYAGEPDPEEPTTPQSADADSSPDKGSQDPDPQNP